ncbi:MAG TPA: indole-3-glycerol phosphate synthase TrpC [Bryobacteraceae bacterium]|nr:indole-3-glycerol phosphate synthase TrpC [Bryobacteraceae bacterium]
MVAAATGILARIAAHKRAELPGVRACRAELERKATDRNPARDFRAVLHDGAIIAEIKKASPSRGILAENFNPVEIAKTYARGGAAALSVLTDREFFQGSLEDLQAARASVAIPVLRKDFTLDEVHVIEAAAHGADAILLIAALLDGRELRDFRELAAKFGMAALVEVHDADELRAAIDSGADIAGVNNRDLNTFETRLETSLKLAGSFPDNCRRIAESGIGSKQDIERLRAAGFDAFLIGEHLMKSPDAAAALRALR